MIGKWYDSHAKVPLNGLRITIFSYVVLIFNASSNYCKSEIVNIITLLLNIQSHKFWDVELCSHLVEYSPASNHDDKCAMSNNIRVHFRFDRFEYNIGKEFSGFIV